MKSIMAFLCLLISIKLTAQVNPIPKPRHKFIVIAHRGDHVIYPENTLAAYSQAIKNGVDYIEIDLRTTSDGKLVSMHDATVNRMTGSKGAISDLTLEQVKSLKIKNDNKSDTVTYKVPLFEEILKLCRDKIYIYIDFKEADATQTLNMLKRYGMEKQVLIYINKPSQIADWRNTNAAMPLMLSLPDSTKTIIGMQQFIDQYHPDVLDGNYTGYTADMVAYAAKMNLTAWPDVQSVAEDNSVWEKAVALGFKGVQTDHPASLISWLVQKGLR